MSTRSAIIIKPPDELIAQIQEIRKQHDKDYKRWMPHIKLVYPFVDEKEFLSIKSKIVEAVSFVPPFEITMNKFSSVIRGQGAHIVLKTQPVQAVRDLQQAFKNVFSGVNLSSRDIHPHLTVAQTQKDKVPAFIQQITKGYNAIKWEVNEVCIVSRELDGDFTVKHVIKLSGVPKPPKAKNLKKGVVYVDGKYVRREKRPDFDFNPRSELPRIASRFQSWARNPNKVNHLPQTRDSLVVSLQPFIGIQVQVVTTEYIMQKLIAENYLEIDEEGDPVLIDRKFTRFPTEEENPLHFSLALKEVQLDVLSRCFKWLSSLDLGPATVEGLKKCLDQLSYEKLIVDTTLIVQYFQDKKLITIDPETQVVSYLFITK